MSISKETIKRQLQITSNQIATSFDSLYAHELKIYAEEIAESYLLLLMILNNKDQNPTPDQDFQSGLIFWTGLNTIMAAMDLLRRGYHKEPMMLLRDAIETFSSAYDIHVNPQKLPSIQAYPHTFDSKKSIAIATKVQPMIGRFYGLLSEQFTHVSTMHTIPHHPEPFCIGGLHNPKEQQATKTSTLILLTTLYPLLSLIELSFINQIKLLRYWQRDNNNALYLPIPEIKNNMDSVIAELRTILSEDGASSI